MNAADHNPATWQLRELLSREHTRRVYYQDLVYAACKTLDRLEGHKPGDGICCGTAAQPTDELRDALLRLEARIAQLESNVGAARRA